MAMATLITRQTGAEAKGPRIERWLISEALAEPH